MGLQIPASDGATRGLPGAAAEYAHGQQEETILDARIPARSPASSKGDAQRAAGALRSTVEAEAQFRGIVDAAQPGRMDEAARQFARVPHGALTDTADPVEQAALIGQLDQNMALHEDRLRLRTMQDAAQEMQQLREQRLNGLLHDAAEAGGMAAAGDTGLQQRAFMHLSGAMLSMEQTVTASARLLGEDDAAVHDRVETSRSGMTGGFLARLAQGNPEYARALLEQAQPMMREADVEQTRKGIASSMQERAFRTLEAEHSDGKTVDYDAALARLEQDSAFSGLTADDASVVRDRLRVARTRQVYVKEKEDTAQRKKAFDDFYASVDSGDMLRAQHILDEDTVLSSKQRKQMRTSLTHAVWRTTPSEFLSLSAAIRKGDLDEPLDVIPGAHLSVSDADMLRGFTQKASGRAGLENKLLFRFSETLLEAMEGASEEERADALRSLYKAVSDARARGDDVTALLTPRAPGNLLEAFLEAWQHRIKGLPHEAFGPVDPRITSFDPESPGDSHWQTPEHAPDGVGMDREEAMVRLLNSASTD